MGLVYFYRKILGDVCCFYRNIQVPFFNSNRDNLVILFVKNTTSENRCKLFSRKTERYLGTV